MAKYEEDLPSFHIDIDEFEDLIDVLCDRVDPSGNLGSELEIKITEGNLTKTYSSVNEVREDATLPSELQDVSITVKDESTRVRMYWDSTGSHTTSKIRIKGDDTLVKSKADDLRRFFKNHQNRWRDLFSKFTTQLFASLVVGLLLGIILNQTILQRTGALTVGIVIFNIMLYAQFGINRVYARNLVILRPDSARVNSVKKVLQIVITTIAALAGLITTSNYIF